MSKYYQYSNHISSGRRSSSRRRTLSKERRQSLLFEDQMATYCFVEIAEGFCPSSKSSAGLEPAPELPPPSPKALSSSGSMDKPVSSPHWTMTNSSPAFVIRVPNESIVRLFSFLVSSPLHYCELASHYDVIQIRNYETKYLCSELPLEPGLGFTILTMETLQNRCGEAKVRNCSLFNEKFTRKVESSLCKNGQVKTNNGAFTFSNKAFRNFCIIFFHLL